MKNFSLVKQGIRHLEKDISDGNLLTFVTICFSGEFANLLLQARSLSLYGNNVIKKWIIVINSEITDEEKENITNSLQK